MSNNFFVIHNYNTVPTELLSFTSEGKYILYDCSDDGKTKAELKQRGIEFIDIPNTGHNITSYFKYLADNYDNLPEVVELLKGNILGRHCSKEYFSKVYENNYFTYLYENEKAVPSLSKGYPDVKQTDIAFLTSESKFVELNNSWYVDSPDHPHRYFDNLDDLLKFVFIKPIVPKWCLFAPGACYIVRREQVMRHSATFYRNLNKLMDYGTGHNFASEAHQIERILPLIFDSTYEANPWMNDEAEFDSRIMEIRKNMELAEKAKEERRGRHKFFRKIYRLVKH